MAADRSTESTIGAVHWESLWTATDGERIAFVVPGFFVDYHVPYLTSALTEKLRSLFGDEIEVSLAAGRRIEGFPGWSYERGTIEVSGVPPPPWPNPREVR